MRGNPSPSPTPIDTDNLSLLYQCDPCGNSQCSFSAGENLPDEVYSLIVGTPIGNCQQGSTSSITSTIQGSITIGDTWSEEADIGLQFSSLQLIDKSTWSQTKSVQWSQSITITIQPGQMGALIANIQYKRTSGTLSVGSGQGFPLISNQPITVVNYSSGIASCGSVIPANVSSPVNCTSSAHTWLQRDTLSTGSLVPMIVSAFFVVSLLI